MKTPLEMYLGQVYPEWRTKHQIDVALGAFDQRMGRNAPLRTNQLSVEILGMLKAQTLEMGSKGFRLKR